MVDDGRRRSTQTSQRSPQTQFDRSSKQYNNILPGSNQVHTIVTACALSTVASSSFSTKIRPTAITMPIRHKALQSMMRRITNKDTILTHTLTGHVSLITVQDNSILSEYQWAQVTTW